MTESLAEGLYVAWYMHPSLKMKDLKAFIDCFIEREHQDTFTNQDVLSSLANRQSQFAGIRNTQNNEMRLTKDSPPPQHKRGVRNFEETKEGKRSQLQITYEFTENERYTHRAFHDTRVQVRFSQQGSIRTPRKPKHASR